MVNGMFFARGSAGDYDAWEELGNPGWNWENLLGYFKKVGRIIGRISWQRFSAERRQSETFNPPSEEIANEFPGIISEDLAPHGTDGSVDSSFSNYQFPVIRELAISDAETSPTAFEGPRSRPVLMYL